MAQTARIIDKDRNESTIEFEDTPFNESGTEGDIYWSTDKKQVVKLYKVPKNEKIIYEILLARQETEDFNNTLAWITHIVVDDNGAILGVVMPNVSSDSWMEPLSWYRHYKAWRGMPDSSRRGDFRGRVLCAMSLATGVRCLFSLGYAHSDLSHNNFFMNPVEGRGMLIDLDGLIVQNYHQGDIIGTQGYMAPELVTRELRRPNKNSDCFALAVCLYEMFTMEHPLLDGAKIAKANDAQEDLRLSLGEQAVYREHPTDTSNHPPQSNFYISAEWLGPTMQDLFKRTFVDGLHDPEKRPHPREYETALKELLDDLVKCERTCMWGYFPASGAVTDQHGNKGCPICGSPLPMPPAIGIMEVMEQLSPGIYDNQNQRRVNVLEDIDVTRREIMGSSRQSQHGVFKIAPTSTGWNIMLTDDIVALRIPPDTGHLSPLTINQPIRISRDDMIFVQIADERRILRFQDL